MKKPIVSLSGLGSLGAAIAAATPCCFPLLASVGSTLGLGALGQHASWAGYISQVLGLLLVLGVYIGSKQHGKLEPVVLCVIGIVGLFTALNLLKFEWLLYTSLLALASGAIWHQIALRANRHCDCKEFTTNV
ncbi:MerC family mercury resistance protein [Paraferrimonas sedimenticola]|uniref:MerC family mercury resistance protein n=1 Tax=Paraferrimonas sedimenticola TaxID=375674 RepID=UPI000BA91D45